MLRGRATATVISQALGQGNPGSFMVASAVLVIISIFYIYTVASFVEANTYPLNGRITLVTSFNVHITNNHIDHVIIASGTLLWLVLSIRGKTKLIAPSIFAGLLLLAVSTGNQVLLQIVALISIPIVFSFFVYDSLSSRKIINMNLRILINYFAVMAIVLGIIGIVTILHYIFSVPHQNLMFIRNYAFDLFILLSSFSSILIFLLVACFPVKVIMKKIQTRIWKGIDNSINLVEINSINAKNRITYLLLFMSLSIVLALIPHMPIINPDYQQVGVDTVYYVAWITPLMRSDNIHEILWQAFVVQNEGDRPLSLLLLYTAMELAKVNPFLISEYSPVILGPALVLAVYFLTRELTSYNDKISLLATFLTAFSFHMLIGVYAGFYANWLALIVGYSSFAFLFRSLKKPCKKNLILFSTTMVILLFTHVYTWGIFTIVMGIFLFLMLILHYYPKKTIIHVSLVILSIIAIDATRMMMTGSTGGLGRDIELVSDYSGLGQFSMRWNNLDRAIHIFLGGLFSNFIIFALCIYWLYRTCWREQSTIFLMAFLSVGLFPLLFGNWVAQSRVFYDIPFQIPANSPIFYNEKTPWNLTYFTNMYMAFGYVY